MKALFRLKCLTNLRKYIKNQPVGFGSVVSYDGFVMKKVSPKKGLCSTTFTQTKTAESISVFM